MSVTSRIAALEQRDERGGACPECGYYEGAPVEFTVSVDPAVKREIRKPNVTCATCRRPLSFTINLNSENDGGGETYEQR
jgi:hypothetical protein